MAFRKLRKNIRHRRLGQWLRVNFKYSRRKVRRFFAGGVVPALKSDIGRRLTFAGAGVLLSVAVVIGALCASLYGQNAEAIILKKLTYGKGYNAEIPYFRTLDALGSSSHLCVTVQTAPRDNLRDRDVALEQGGINLKLSFKDGTSSELPLQKKFRGDSFVAGKQTNFILALPFGYTPFDITSFSLSITAGADGMYDDWLCERAEVSFLLSAERVLLASSETGARLGSGQDMLRTLELEDRRSGNTHYQQSALLFDKLLALANEGLTDFADSALKKETLDSLHLASATALYLDIETVSPERNSALLSALGEDSRIPENEDLNYNGKLWVDVTFTTPLADGTHTLRYTLDTPGKDDFELAGSSTFRMEMPEGMCVFDIMEVSLSLADKRDAWAPRFARLYLTLDFDKELELARLTDTHLLTQYDAAIFYQGFLENVAFDLRRNNAIPAVEYPAIEKDYGRKPEGAAYAMYFENQSYFSRQINFYQHMLGLI